MDRTDSKIYVYFLAVDWPALPLSHLVNFEKMFSICPRLFDSYYYNYVAIYLSISIYIFALHWIYDWSGASWWK